jgi:hypothetical protein
MPALLNHNPTGTHVTLDVAVDHDDPRALDAAAENGLA